MILVDTSIWVDHLRKGDSDLASLLQEGLVYCHPFVIGELACGNLKNRQEILTLLGVLPTCETPSHEEALNFLDDHNLSGKGLGWVDLHLLASSLLSSCQLWTRDKALLATATRLKVAYEA